MNCFRCGVEIHTPYSMSIDGKASCSAFCFAGQPAPAAPAIVVEVTKPAPKPVVVAPQPPKPVVKAPEPKTPSPVAKSKAIETPRKKGKK